mmetsp:Transcript_148519/g.262260  ORF Transcript_148519/g.262260 Transcript_148519/m.262260 type:complete len:192 (-) Transcript_148519:63-638(-)
MVQKMTDMQRMPPLSCLNCCERAGPHTEQVVGKDNCDADLYRRPNQPFFWTKEELQTELEGGPLQELQVELQGGPNAIFAAGFKPLETPLQLKPGAPREFNIELNKGTEKLGCDLDFSDGRTLKIHRISPGILTRWNDENPLKRVDEGDLFVRVNKKIGDSKMLVREIVEAKRLVILVRKLRASENCSALV